MNLIRSLIYILIPVVSCHATGSIDTTSPGKQTDIQLTKAGKWFSAWELVSKKIDRIDTLQPVDFVFYTDSFVYSTSTISIPAGEPVIGPGLLDKKLNWYKAAHNGMLTLPDGQQLPLGLHSFAAPLPGRNAFFVMPLPAFWEKAGVQSEELGLDNLLTGVFLHEFSHSQQMRNFGSSMSEFEKKHRFKSDFTDDLVQACFEKDSVYTNRFREETALFYAAAMTDNNIHRQQWLIKAFQHYHSRQDTYFNGEYEVLKTLDDFFLSMEGLGQYSMYAWLVHPKGGNLSKETALRGVRRGGKWWSQEEGMALFLVLEKLLLPHQGAAAMFGTKTVSVIELIKTLME